MSAAPRTPSEVADDAAARVKLAPFGKSERATLSLVRDGRPLPQVPETLFAMANLAEAGLVEVERSAEGDPVRWVVTTAGHLALFLELRPNARGVVSRGRIRRLVEAGRVEARLDFHYDDSTGSRTESDWYPVRIAPEVKVPPGHFRRVEAAGGAIVLDADWLAGDRGPGRAYVTEPTVSTRGVALPPRLFLKVHSNLRYELRLVEAS